MNETYLIVNGKRIDLPKEVVRNIVNATARIPFSERIEEECWTIFQSIWSGAERSYVSTSMENVTPNPESNVRRLTLRIELPYRNSDWTFSVFETCKKFCEDNSDRFPIHYPHLDSRYLFIRVEDEK